MNRFEPKAGRATGLVARWGGTLALLAAALWTPAAHAYPMYDDGFGVGCVSCHNGFQSGTGALHQRHRIDFAVTSCNVCHPAGGGTTPVRTYWSGAGGGLGCAGCHGQDYGEISPNSGQPKATAYGLRLFHVAQGVTTCGLSGCHQPGTQGHPNPFPTPYGENVPPPYYSPLFSNLTDPCSSAQEDLSTDADSLGLDNDGDGFADWPADSDCPQPPDTPTPTPTATPIVNTPTPTLGIHCGTAPALACIAPAKGSLLVDEKKPGKEKLKVTLGKLQTAVAQSQFGDPVGGATQYKVCIYDSGNVLRGDYTVVRAGAICGAAPCFSAVSTTGYKYKDKSAAADGITMMKLGGGAAGKGKVKIKGKNSSGQLPTGVAALLLNQSSATVQVMASDAACFGIGLTQVKRADGTVFKAAGP